MLDDAQLFDRLADGVVVVGEDNTVLRANQSMARLLGKTARQLVGTDFADYLADTEVLALVGLNAAFGEQDLAHLQTVFRGPANAYVFTSVAGMREPPRDGEPGYYVLCCRNHAAIHDLLNESTRLAAELTERADHLEEQRAAAEQRERETAALSHQSKLESIGQLAAGIAHEINTPVQFIGDNVTFLQRAFAKLWPVVEAARCVVDTAAECDPQALPRAIRKAKLDFLGPEIPKAIAQTQEGVERVAKIVRAMKDFSHPGSTEKQPTNLNKAIESTVTVARTEWKYVAELDLQLDPALPAVPCHVDEFNQVVLNMLVNAAHAIQEKLDDGEVGRICIRTHADDTTAYVEIEDSGSGIPEEVVAKIFDPFFTTKEVGRGTGQGLSLAYNVIARRHGGAIDVKSAPGEGTCFTLKLPLTPSAATTSMPSGQGGQSAA